MCCHIKPGHNARDTKAGSGEVLTGILINVSMNAQRQEVREERTFKRRNLEATSREITQTSPQWEQHGRCSQVGQNGAGSVEFRIRNASREDTTPDTHQSTLTMKLMDLDICESIKLKMYVKVALSISSQGYTEI